MCVEKLQLHCSCYIFSITKYGFTVKGNAKFNDGFVVSIAEFQEVKDQDYQSFEVTEKNVTI